MTFVILLKLHVWEKSDPWVKCKNALGQSITYLLKLQIDDVILGGRDQACSGMPKEAIKT